MITFWPTFFGFWPPLPASKNRELPRSCAPTKSSRYCIFCLCFARGLHLQGRQVAHERRTRHYRKSNAVDGTFAHLDRERMSRPKRSDGRYPCNIFDKEGSCKFGDKCKFSHLGSDDAGLPEGAPSKAADKVPICTQFESGECKYAERCRFAHGDTNEAQLAALANQKVLKEDDMHGILAMLCIQESVLQS